LKQHDLFGKPEPTFPDHAARTNEYARSRQGSERFFREIRARSGTDDGDLWRIEVPVRVQNRLGTKAAQREDEDSVLENCHLTATILGGPKSR
jgi:hypothetical protein